MPANRGTERVPARGGSMRAATSWATTRTASTATVSSEPS